MLHCCATGVASLLRLLEVIRYATGASNFGCWVVNLVKLTSSKLQTVMQLPLAQTAQLDDCCTPKRLFVENTLTWVYFSFF